MSLSGKVSGMYRQDSATTAFTDLVLIDSGDHITYKADPTAVGKVYWDNTQPIVVQVAPDGVTYAAPTVTYTIEYLSGRIIFSSALAVDAKVRVSGSAYAIAQVGGAYGWSIDMKVDTVDSTTFSGNGWKEYLSSFKSWTGKVEKFWVNEAEFNLFNQTILFVFFATIAGERQRYEGYGTIQSQNVAVSTGDIIKAPLEITGIGRLYYRSD